MMPAAFVTSRRPLAMHARALPWRTLLLVRRPGGGIWPRTKARAADLVVGAFGGVWEQSLSKCMIDPWQKATGKTVDVVLGTPIAMAEPDRRQQGQAAPRSTSSTCRPKPPTTPSTSGVVDQLHPRDGARTRRSLAAPVRGQIGGGYGVPHNYGGMGILYNAGHRQANPPKTWKRLRRGNHRRQVEGLDAHHQLPQPPASPSPSGGSPSNSAATSATSNRASREIKKMQASPATSPSGATPTPS